MQIGIDANTDTGIDMDMDVDTSVGVAGPKITLVRLHVNALLFRCNSRSPKHGT